MFLKTVFVLCVLFVFCLMKFLRVTLFAFVVAFESCFFVINYLVAFCFK